MSGEHHVVIVGGGFGGLHTALDLKNAPVRVTLVDKRNFHLFQPLLYQVATGALSPANIAAPLRAILKRHRNTEVLLAEAIAIDPERHTLILSDGELSYDTLILSTGSTHSYFGRNDWEPLAPGLKTIEDSTEIRKRILLAFEHAERETDQEKIRALLTFVVVGAGPTGVELAGALSEIARHTLSHDFRHINPAQTRVVLIEAGPHVLGVYPEALALKGRAALERIHVEVRTSTSVTDIDENGVHVKTTSGEEFIAARTTLWAAGVAASPLGKALADASGIALDKAGRIHVAEDLSVPGCPGVYVVGDLAHFEQGGKPLPGVAPVAMQQGHYMAKVIRQRLAGKTVKPFHYLDLGSMATIGRAAAVVSMGPLQFAGFLAWLTWLFVHIMKLVQFQNRVLVFFQWAYSYTTWNRAARLITGDVAPHLRQGTDTKN